MIHLQHKNDKAYLCVLSGFYDNQSCIFNRRFITSNEYISTDCDAYLAKSRLYLSQLKDIHTDLLQLDRMIYYNFIKY